MKTLFLAGAALAMLTVSAAPTAAADTIETPDYERLGGEGAIELRRYAPHLVAEVTVEAPNRDVASSRGFRPLAAYIFGGNADGQEIAMTAPVTTGPAEEDVTQSVTASNGAYTVRFSMPSKFTMDALPAPRDDSVTLREMPAQTLAVHGFTGARTETRVAEVEASLRAYLDEEGHTPTGPMTTAGYDGPDVPRGERRWEVWIPVDPAG